MSAMDNAVDNYRAILKKIDEVDLKKDDRDRDSNTYDFVFKYDDAVTMALILDYDDLPFVRIILPNFFSLDSVSEKRKAPMAALETNRAGKCAKLFFNPDEDDTSLAIEFLDSSIEEGDGRGMTQQTLERYLSMMMSAASLYASKMR